MILYTKCILPLVLISLPFFVIPTELSSSTSAMDLKIFVFFAFYVFMTTFATESFSEPRHSTTRTRRSPQRENLSHCNSAFLNFAKFKQRGCPPPKFCTLSRPLKLRYCTKGPGTGVF